MTKNQTPRQVLRGANRDSRTIILEAVDRGWTVRLTGGGHIQLRHPSGAVVITGLTPSSRSSGRALRADIRRVERAAS